MGVSCMRCSDNINAGGTSLVPRPHPPTGLVNFGGFLGFIGGVVVTNLRSDWSMPPRVGDSLHERLKRDSSYQIPAVRRSYDYGRAAI